MKKSVSAQVWSKSDTRFFARSFFLMAGVMFFYGLNHLLHNEEGEAFTMFFVMLVPLGIAVGFSRLARRRFWEQPNIEDRARRTAFDRATWEQSFLNPEHDFNLDRIKHPPEIG